MRVRDTFKSEQSTRGKMDKLRTESMISNLKGKSATSTFRNTNTNKTVKPGSMLTQKLESIGRDSKK